MAYSQKTHTLRGDIEVSGDKSISHRALMFGALAVGQTCVSNLLEGTDILHTAGAMRAMGADIIKNDKGEYIIHGVGVGGLQEPTEALYFGNAGTGARLTMGLCATHPMTAIFHGDASLSKRPMGRILTPLRQFGATTTGRSGDKLPLALVGTDEGLPIEYHLPMASAQVKSAILLAGLNVGGTTIVHEPIKTRDHTEKMLTYFGADLHIEEKDQGRSISLKGHSELKAQNIHVPADPSSAAFPICAALICENSEILVKNVLINPTRNGLFITLQEMGADLTFENERIVAGEKIADIRAKSSELKGITVPPERAASMIDEYPILMIVAACATGQTVMRGIEELRVKESDRIHAMCQGLEKIGVKFEEFHDGVIIHQSLIIGGVSIETFMDHRIAMSFLIAGTVANMPIQIDNTEFIDTSFPNFISLMNKIGCKIDLNDLKNTHDT